jgi:hypothetical protein
MSVRMPLRYWRWYWLSQALRLLAWLLVAILSLVYFPALILVWAIDQGSGQYYRFRMYLLKLDMDRSGWTPPSPSRMPAPALRVVRKPGAL